MADQFDMMILPASALQSARISKTKKHGHAAIPGTGPEGETCGSCAHLHRNVMSRTYLKCELRRADWTGGNGTDVRARDSACRRWSRPDAAQQKAASAS